MLGDLYDPTRPPSALIHQAGRTIGTATSSGEEVQTKWTFVKKQENNYIVIKYFCFKFVNCVKERKENVFVTKGFDWSCNSAFLLSECALFLSIRNLPEGQGAAECSLCIESESIGHAVTAVLHIR